jgi:hypothetical protein
MCNGSIISFFCFGKMTVPIGLIYVDPLTRSFFSWTLRISKPFKFPNFSAPQPLGRIARVVEIERNLFHGKRIITLLPTAHIKLYAVVHAKSNRFSLLLSKPFSFHSLLAAPHHLQLHQISNIIGDVTASVS